MAKQSSDVMVARETFATLSDGRPIIIRRKITRLRVDDPIVKANAGRFELADAGLPELEQATSAPGERRGAERATAAPGEKRDPTKAELIEEAEKAGVEVKSSDTKADIAEKLDKG